MNKILVHIAPTRSGHNFLRYNLCSWLQIDPRAHYWNFEDIFPENVKEKINQKCQKIKKHREPNLNFIYVISNRDLLNWIASIYKQQENHNQFTKVILDHWVATTKEIFNETNYLPNKIPIIFDKFVKERSYRLKICNQIKGKYNEDFISHVPRANQGSSFDQLKFQNKGHKMEVTTRYKAYLTNTLFRANIYGEALDLYQKYFELDQEKRNFINSINEAIFKE